MAYLTSFSSGIKLGLSGHSSGPLKPSRRMPWPTRRAVEPALFEYIILRRGDRQLRSGRPAARQTVRCGHGASNSASGSDSNARPRKLAVTIHRQFPPWDAPAGDGGRAIPPEGCTAGSENCVSHICRPLPRSTVLRRHMLTAKTTRHPALPPLNTQEDLTQ